MAGRRYADGSEGQKQQQKISREINEIKLIEISTEIDLNQRTNRLFICEATLTNVQR